MTLNREEVLCHYAEVEPEVEAGAYHPYREVLAETARRVADRLGWPITLERAAFLPESLPHWQPFPDTNLALSRLAAAGYRLGILSNIDDDLLAGTRRLLGMPFDLVITAQQVRSYKPAPGHFLTARERIGGERWLHAARSTFHDVVPASALGIPTAWVNRKGEPSAGDARPTMECKDLADLAERLT